MLQIPESSHHAITAEFVAGLYGAEEEVIAQEKVIASLFYQLSKRMIPGREVAVRLENQNRVDKLGGDRYLTVSQWTLHVFGEIKDA